MEIDITINDFIKECIAFVKHPDTILTSQDNKYDLSLYDALNLETKQSWRIWFKEEDSSVKFIDENNTVNNRTEQISYEDCKEIILQYHLEVTRRSSKKNLEKTLSS